MPVKSRRALGKLVFAILMMAGGLLLNGALSRARIFNAHDITSGLIFVAIGLVVFRRELKIRSIGACLQATAYIESILFLTLCLFSLAYLVKTAIGHDLVVLPARIQWIGVRQSLAPRDLASIDGSIGIFIVHAMISSPLWEELFRGCAQEGLKFLRINKWLALSAIAAYFAYVHYGYAITSLAFFLFMGLMIEYGFTWLERALVHALGNGLATANMIYTNIGGSDRTSWDAQLTSLTVQAVALLIFIACMSPSIYRRFQRQRRWNGSD